MTSPTSSPAASPEQAGPDAKALRNYILAGSHRVQGWLDPEILRVVRRLAAEQRKANVSGSVVEIGVHHGRLLIGLILTRQVQTEKALAIDLFDEQQLNIDLSGKGNKQTFRRHLSRYGLSDNVQLLAADSTTLSPMDVTDRVGLVRLFSVDGGHTAEIVESDMAVAAGSLAPGGIIIGDDVFNAGWPGTVEGTLAFLDNTPEIVPFATCFNKVLFCDREHAPLYREALFDLADRHFWRPKESFFRGHTVVHISSRLYQDRVRLLAKRVLRRG